MDTDRIPTEPTTDHVPPSATSSRPVPPRRRRLRRPVVDAAREHRCGHRPRVRGDVQCWDRGRQPARRRRWRTDGDHPGPSSPGRPTEFALIEEAWDTLHREYVGRDELDDQQLIWGAIDGLTQAVGDTGHTDFMTPEEREQRRKIAVGLLCRHRRPHRRDGGRPAAHRRRVQGQPGRGGRPSGRRRHRRRRRHSRPPARPRRGRQLVRGEAGTDRQRHRPGRTAPAPSGRSTSSARMSPIEPVSWTMVPGTTTALIRLDQFSNGAADASSRPSRTPRRRAPIGSSSTCAAIPAATSTRRSASPASS